MVLPNVYRVRAEESLTDRFLYEEKRLFSVTKLCFRCLRTEFQRGHLIFRSNDALFRLPQSSRCVL